MHGSEYWWCAVVKMVCKGRCVKMNIRSICQFEMVYQFNLKKSTWYTFCLILKICCFHYDSYHCYWFAVFESIESVNGGGCCYYCSVIELCPNLCDPMNCSTSGFPVLHCLPDFAQTHVHWVSDTIQTFHFMLPPSLALNLSQHQSLFRSVGSVHQVAKVFSFSISPSNEYSGFISFRIDWFDLVVQEALKSLL